MSTTTPIVNFSHIASMLGDPAEERTLESFDEDEVSPEDASLAEHALAELEAAEVDPDVLCAPDDQAAALLQTFLAERAIEEGRVRRTDVSNTLEAQFDERDIGWLRDAVPFIRSKLGIARRDPRPPLRRSVDQVSGTVRLALLGDWGTNLYGARPAARSVESDGSYTVIVHLGDVYYSGSEEEIQERFLSPWRIMTDRNPDALSRACNSNHEMFSGGGPYFRLTLPAFGQSSSAFALSNDDWLIIGLDTAYDEHDIDAEQVSWLNAITADVATRRVVLLSHHQPFSHFAKQGSRMLDRLEPLLATGRVFAWYWGHEHLHALYEPDERWGFHGRCVGHSGFPYPRPDGLVGMPRTELQKDLAFVTIEASANAPAARVLDGPNEYVGDRRDRYGPNGYMRLELDGTDLREVVLAPDGTELWSGDLS